MSTLESARALERTLWIAAAAHPFVSWSNHGLRHGAKKGCHHDATEPN